MLDFLPMGGGVLLQQVTIDTWAGKALRDLDITNKHGVMAVAVKRVGDSDFTFVPDPKAPLSKGDSLLLIGKPEEVMALEA